MNCNQPVSPNLELDSQVLEYCENQIELISKLKTIKHIDVDILEISGDCNSFLRENFDSLEYCCSDIRYSVDWHFKENLSIPLALESEYRCQGCPIALRCFDYFSILINNSNQLLVEGDYCKMDSLQDEIEEFYLTKIGTKGHHSRIEPVRFRLQWDTEASKDSLNLALTKLVNSYLLIMQDLSIQEFSQDLCNINSDQLSEIYKILPFKLEICWHFVPFIIREQG